MAAAAELTVDVFNPGDKALFPVSAEIVSGPKEAVLIDAQMARNDAETLVERIRATGKHLKAVYISQSDPDFYFGLETIRAAFPRVPIYATSPTIAAINATKDDKLKYWTPRLEGGAPEKVILPTPLRGDTLTVDGQRLKIIGLDGPTPARTFVWIPSIKTVLGGTAVFVNSHVFIADTQSACSRADWKATLSRIETLNPAVVVPGHYFIKPGGGEPRGLESVRFTRDYIEAFEVEAAASVNSSQLRERMKARYPLLKGESILDISAKVIKGELAWPARPNH